MGSLNFLSLPGLFHERFFELLPQNKSVKMSRVSSVTQKMFKYKNKHLRICNSPLLPLNRVFTIGRVLTVTANDFQFPAKLEALDLFPELVSKFISGLSANQRPHPPDVILKNCIFDAKNIDLLRTITCRRIDFQECIFHGTFQMIIDAIQVHESITIDCESIATPWNIGVILIKKEWISPLKGLYLKNLKGHVNMRTMYLFQNGHMHHNTFDILLGFSRSISYNMRRHIARKMKQHNRREGSMIYFHQEWTNFHF